MVAAKGRIDLDEELLITPGAIIGTITAAVTWAFIGPDIGVVFKVVYEYFIGPISKTDIENFYSSIYLMAMFYVFILLSGTVMCAFLITAVQILIYSAVKAVALAMVVSETIVLTMAVSTVLLLYSMRGLSWDAMVSIIFTHRSISLCKIQTRLKFRE
ncbi:MAG: hypothetical protein V2I31_04570 [Mariniphaga sp.]|jgi:hypothetical protein|nr:hypothetical protein [Mariniphaga sp.]